MKLLITRPKADSEDVADLVRKVGAEPVIEPLIFIEPVSNSKLDMDGVQALLFTSANGLRAFAKRESGRDLPVYTVGDSSARAAIEAGFETVESASGDVNALAALVAKRLIPKKGALLHPAGARVAGDLAGLLARKGFDYRRAVLYTQRKAKTFTEKTRQALSAGKLDGVMLYSPRTAAIFGSLLRAAGLENACRNLTVFCFSEAVAEKIAGLPWKASGIAKHPSQDAIMALVQDAMKDSQNERDPLEDRQIRKGAPHIGRKAPAADERPAQANKGPKKSHRLATGLAACAILVAVAYGSHFLWWPRVQDYLSETLRLKDSRLTAVSERIEYLESYTALFKSQNDTILGLEKEQTRLRKDLNGLIEQLTRLESTGDASAIKKRLSLLEDRVVIRDLLDRAEKKPVSDPRATEAIAEMAGRLDILEKREKQQLTAEMTTLAVTRLHEAVRSGRPFAASLKTVKTLLGSQTGPADAIAALDPLAAGGAPTLEALRKQFDKMLTVIAQTSRTEPGKGWVDWVVESASSLITVRKDGKTLIGANGVSGPIAHALAGAKQSLDDGDLGAAISAVEALEGRPAEAFWLKDARTHLGAENALMTLHAYALSLSHGGG